MIKARIYNLNLHKFPQLIKKIMDDKTISQSELASITGIDKSTVNRVLNGKLDPSVTTAGKILNALKMHSTTIDTEA